MSSPKKRQPAAGSLGTIQSPHSFLFEGVALIQSDNGVPHSKARLWADSGALRWRSDLKTSVNFIVQTQRSVCVPPTAWSRDLDLDLDSDLDLDPDSDLDPAACQCGAISQWWFLSPLTCLTDGENEIHNLVKKRWIRLRCLFGKSFDTNNFIFVNYSTHLFQLNIFNLLVCLLGVTGNKLFYLQFWNVSIDNERIQIKYKTVF